MTAPVLPVTSSPTLGQALVPVVALMGMLAGAVALFGDESSSGPNQIALILGTSIAVLVALVSLACAPRPATPSWSVTTR